MGGPDTSQDPQSGAGGDQVAPGSSSAEPSGGRQQDAEGARAEGSGMGAAASGGDGATAGLERGGAAEPEGGATAASARGNSAAGVEGASPAAAAESTGGPTPAAAEEPAECRICLMPDAPGNLVSPCHCTGTVRYAHLSCLVRWSRERASTRCEICGSTYRPEVLPQVEAAVKAQQRLAEVLRLSQGHEAAAAVAAGVGGEGGGSPERGGRATRWLLLKVALVLAVAGALLYLVFFLGSQDGQNMWAAVLLRVLIFIIPAYFIYRGISACMRYHNGNVDAARAITSRERREARERRETSPPGTVVIV